MVTHDSLAMWLLTHNFCGHTCQVLLGSTLVSLHTSLVANETTTKVQSPSLSIYIDINLRGAIGLETCSKFDSNPNKIL